MSAELYDTALLNKLNSWMANVPLHIYGVSDTKRLFETIAYESKDKAIQLPIVCLRRKQGYTILKPNRVPLQTQGVRLKSDKGTTRVLRAIPINIEYQLDVYCRLYSEADSYMRELIFNLINYPRVSVTIPYKDENYEHYSNVRVAQEVEDNSDVPERLISGQFTRLSLNLTIDDAYLWDVADKHTLRIENAEVEVND